MVTYIKNNHAIQCLAFVNHFGFSADDSHLLAFAILPFVLPSCGRTFNLNADNSDEEDDVQTRPSKRRRTQTTVKSSDLATLHAMILFKPVSLNLLPCVFTVKFLNLFLVPFSEKYSCRRSY